MLTIVQAVGLAAGPRVVAAVAGAGAAGRPLREGAAAGAGRRGTLGGLAAAGEARRGRSPAVAVGALSMFHVTSAVEGGEEENYTQADPGPEQLVCNL